MTVAKGSFPNPARIELTSSVQSTVRNKVSSMRKPILEHLHDLQRNILETIIVCSDSNNTENMTMGTKALISINFIPFRLP